MRIVTTKTTTNLNLGLKNLVFFLLLRIGVGKLLIEPTKASEISFIRWWLRADDEGRGNFLEADRPTSEKSRCKSDGTSLQGKV